MRARREPCVGESRRAQVATVVAAKVADLGGYNLSSDAASVVLPRALGGTSGSVVVIAWEEPPVAPPPAGLTTQDGIGAGYS